MVIIPLKIRSVRTVDTEAFLRLQLQRHNPFEDQVC